MHHSHCRHSYPFGKAPSRDVKAALKRLRGENMRGHHHSEEGEPQYKLHLNPKLAKAWQALKRLQTKKTRACRTDQDGVPLALSARVAFDTRDG